MDDCVFCRIGRNELPSFRIDETEEFCAFMDIYPPTFGDKITMPVVIITTKEHKGSNVFENLGKSEFSSLLLYTRKIARAVQSGLSPERVCLVFEGMEIDHVHPKLYPVFKDSYPGYLSTEKGPANKGRLASAEKLQYFAARIRAVLEDECKAQTDSNQSESDDDGL